MPFTCTAQQACPRQHGFHESYRKRSSFPSSSRRSAERDGSARPSDSSLSLFILTNGQRLPGVKRLSSFVFLIHLRLLPRHSRAAEITKMPDRVECVYVRDEMDRLQVCWRKEKSEVKEGFVGCRQTDDGSDSGSEETRRQGGERSSALIGGR